MPHGEPLLEVCHLLHVGERTHLLELLHPVLNRLPVLLLNRRKIGRRAREFLLSHTVILVGHLLGGAGAVAGLAAIKAIETGTIPPTINLETPDPDCDLDYVPNTARTNQPVDRVLINGFEFGGQNASALFGKLHG